MTTELWLIRHGETAWSKSGQHTGRTDLALTEVGIEKARGLGRLIGGKQFAAVFSSPMQRASETARLAGFNNVIVEPGLCEWDYGDYEGRTTPEIRKDRPGWHLWNDGVPNGESIEQVARRANDGIEKAVNAASGGAVALFAHGHILRILAACWIGLEPHAASLFALSTASVSVLSYERETRVISRWNQTG